MEARLHVWFLAAWLPLAVSTGKSRLAIPQFDIVAECDRAMGLPSCIEREHAALGALTFWWNRVPDEGVKTSCIAYVERLPVMRYHQLMSCLAAGAHLPPPQLADLDT